MITIISPSDNLSYNIGQKVWFYVESIENTYGVWSLNDLSEVKENSNSIIEEEGLININNINYNYSLVRFKDVGIFYIEFINNNLEKASFTKNIYGSDTKWVSKQCSLWSKDVGMLCNGERNSIQKINKWSLFKPVRSSIKSLSERDHWENSDLFHQNGAGMKINLWNGFSSYIPFSTFLENISYDDSWEYLQPRGYEYNEYFRLNDFQGYSKLKNNSYLVLNDLSYIKYQLNTNNQFDKTNTDKYILGKSQNNVLSFSDIWLDSNQSNNLGEYYLIAYVIDDQSDRRFFKILNKLSDQNLYNLEIDIPLEDLYKPGGLLYTNYFGVKNRITKYYFLGNIVSSSSSWIEVTYKYTNKFPMDYAPASVPVQHNKLLYIFRNAIAIPITNNIKNYKSQNLVIITTYIPIILKNSYLQKRNIFFQVYQKNDIIPFSYKKLFNESETVSLNVPEITSDNEGRIVFKELYNTDCICWDSNNDFVYEEYYRPNSNNEIEITLNEILSNNPEENWHLIQNRIELIEEKLTLNIYNSIDSNRKFIIKLSNSMDLTLLPNTNNILLTNKGIEYSFINLTTYKFKIYCEDINTITSINIVDHDSRLEIISHSIENDYIELIVYIDLGNGLYDNNINPLDLIITII